MRVFGGTGVFTPELRRYGALWGITLGDANWWPAPVLASARTAVDQATRTPWIDAS